MKKRLVKKLVKQNADRWWVDKNSYTKVFTPPPRWNNPQVLKEAKRFYGADGP